MRFFEEDLLNKARQFIHCHGSSGFAGDSRPLLIAYHGDGDGCTSAFLARRFVNKPALFYWVSTPDFDFKRAETHILEQKPGLTLFLDMPVYNRPSMIEKLATQGTRILIYDHHDPGTGQFLKDLPLVLYINPVLIEGSKAYPTCLFCYELLAEKTALEKQVLYAGLYTETWLEQVPLFDEFSSDTQKNLRDLAKLVHASFLVHDEGTTHHALSFLQKAVESSVPFHGDLHALREHQILVNIHDLMQHEKGWLLRELETKIRNLMRPDSIIMRIDSKIRLCGLIASDLRWKHPGLVIGIWQKWMDRFICELRRGPSSQVNLAHLVEMIKREMPLLTGGGHPEAAAFAAEENFFFQALRKIKTSLAGGFPES